MNKAGKHRGRAAPLLSLICPESKVTASGRFPACNPAPPWSHSLLLHPPIDIADKWIRDLLPNCPPCSHSHHVGQKPQTWRWKCLKWAYERGSVRGSPMGHIKVSSLSDFHMANPGRAAPECTGSRQRQRRRKMLSCRKDLGSLFFVHQSSKNLQRMEKRLKQEQQQQPKTISIS